MRNWLRAKPWQVWPLFPYGWRYHRLYRLYRSGSKHPRTGEWLKGGRPCGRRRALLRALQFPHVHEGEA